MPRIKSFSPKLNLQSYDTFVTDTSENSFYFKVTEFKDTFTGGKNGFLIEGSPYLKESTDLQIEILDVNGDPIYHEPGKGIPEYYEGTAKLVSVHIYEDTPIGIGKITIFGELEDYIDETGETSEVPDAWRNTYNVKWSREFKINKRLPNEDRVRFVRRPRVDITELSGSLFSREFTRTSQTGSVRGIPIQPEQGVNLNTYPGSTFYKLRTTDGSLFSRELLQNGTLSVPSRGFENIQINEIVNETEIIVREVYTDNGQVASFPESDYEIEYDELSDSRESSILSSFSQFKIDQLSTFVGDVARLKVFYKPTLSIGDFELIEDIKLESSELLTLPISGSNIPIGIFTSDYEEFWNVPTVGDYNVTQSNEKVFGGLRIDGGTTSTVPQTISTISELSLSEQTEYTFEFDVSYVGQISDTDYVNVYLEYENENGSTLQEKIIKFNPTPQLSTKQKVTQNVITPIDSDYTLVIEVNGETWHVGNVSFKSSQETSFSPDDVQFTIPVRRDLEVETFDFKFEFFDINSNYIPVDVFKTETFRLGNVNVIDKSIDVDVIPRPFFRFDDAGEPEPEDQKLTVRIKKRRLVGDLGITRTAFDTNGNIIDETDYFASGGFVYPGELTLVSESTSLDTYELHVTDFTGSASDIIVGAIEYSIEEDPTATIAPESTVFTLFRQDKADSARQLQTSSDKTQFTYKRTNQTPAPVNQDIIIDLVKVNISDNSPTIITKDGTGPVLTPADPPTGTEQYTISAAAISSSDFYNADDGTTRYTFSTDFEGVTYESSIKIDAVVLNEPINVNMTKDSHTFAADSDGDLIDDINLGNVNVRLKVGSELISYGDTTTSNNVWEITSYTVNGGTPRTLEIDASNEFITIGLSSFTDNTNATLDFEITYRDGLGEIETLSRTVNYIKSKDAKPNVLVSADPLTQSRSADSLGNLTQSLIDVNLFAAEGDNNVFDNASLISQTGFSTPPSIKNVNVLQLGASSSDMVDDDASVIVQVNYTNSEGNSGSQNIQITVSKSRRGDDGDDGEPGAGGINIDILPPFQIVGTDIDGNIDQPSDFSVIVREGAEILTYSSGSQDLVLGEFRIQNVISGSNNNDGTITPDIPNTLDGSQVQFDVTFFSSGTGETSDPIPRVHDVDVILDGSTGPGIVFTGVWEPNRIYQSADTRRDAVLYSEDGDPSGVFDTYYMTNLTHTSTNDADPDTGRPSNISNIWTTLGKEDFFVAAKIAIFEESFIKNTLNVGTNNDGNLSAANITLWGGDEFPYISIGQDAVLGGQAFEEPGIFIGRDSGSLNPTVPKWSVVDGTSGRGAIWDGEFFTIIGGLRQRRPGDPNPLPDPLFRGVYDNDVEYFPGDIVTYTPDNNLYRIQQWILTGTASVTGEAPADSNNQPRLDWALFGASGIDGEDGGPGDDGVSARSLGLSADVQGVSYNTEGFNPTPPTVTITAESFNTVGTPHYQFFEDGSEEQNSTSNTYELTVKSNYEDMPQKVDVVLREDGITGPILATEQITVFGLRAGSSTLTVILNSDSHVLPADSDGVITSFSGSGVDITAFEGTTQLTYDDSVTPANSTFKVDISLSPNVTPDSSPTTINNVIRRYGDLESMVTNQSFGQIVFDVTITNENGNETVISKVQSFSKSKSGGAGIPGQSSFKAFAFKRTNDTPSTPEGGDYSSPTPTTIEWFDSIPSGSKKLWTSTRIFTSDGELPQEPEWSVPRELTDTETIEYQYSDFTLDQHPGTPDNPATGANWTSDSTTLSEINWLAQRSIVNGDPLDWIIFRVRGDSGLDAKLIKIIAENQIFKKFQDGHVEPTEIELEATTQNLDDPAVLWEDITLDPQNPTPLMGSGTNNEFLTVGSGSLHNNEIIKIRATADGLTDKVTLVKVEEGSDAITTYLTNESHIVQTDSDGNGGDYSGAFTEIIVLQGIEFITSEYNFSANVTSGNATFDHTGDGTTLPSNELNVTSLTTDQATIDITGTSVDFPTITKTFSISKSKQGITGDTGQSSFKSIVFQRAENEPDKPEDTEGSYSAPVPVGWSDGIPSGSFQLWSTTRIFTDDGEPPQGSWTDVVSMTDTETLEFQYSEIPLNEDPGNPTDNEANWSPNPSVDSNWMAQRTLRNGTPQPWQIFQIVGIDGVSSVITNNNGLTWHRDKNGDWDRTTNTELTVTFIRGDVTYTRTLTVTFNDGIISAPSNTVNNIRSIIANSGQSAMTVTFVLELGGIDIASASVNLSVTSDGIDGEGGEQGIQGPATPFRGEFENSPNVTYVYSDIRRDVVLGSDGFYYSLNLSGSFTGEFLNDPTSDAPPPDNHWEPFGAQFESIATDFLFTNQVYANEIINIGTDGVNHVIVLNPDTSNDNANPYISIGQTSGSLAQGYDNNGIFIGFDSPTVGVPGDPKLSLVSDINNYFKWDGSKMIWAAENTSLDADGKFHATDGEFSGTITATSGSILGELGIGAPTSVIIDGSATAGPNSTPQLTISTSGSVTLPNLVIKDGHFETVTHTPITGIDNNRNIRFTGTVTFNTPLGDYVNYFIDLQASNDPNSPIWNTVDFVNLSESGAFELSGDTGNLTVYRLRARAIILIMADGSDGYDPDNTTEYIAEFSNIEYDVSNITIAITPEGIFRRDATGVSLLGSTGGTGGGISTFPSWDQVVDKPFNTIGDGLSVTSNVLSLDASFVDINGTISDAQVPVSAVTQHQGSIDHNSLLNYAVNEHRVWENNVIGQTIHIDNIPEIPNSFLEFNSLTVNTGAGLSGGGEIELGGTRELSFDTVWGDNRYGTLADPNTWTATKNTFNNDVYIGGVFSYGTSTTSGWQSKSLGNVNLREERIDIVIDTPSVLRPTYFLIELTSATGGSVSHQGLSRKEFYLDWRSGGVLQTFQSQTGVVGNIGTLNDYNIGDPVEIDNKLHIPITRSQDSNRTIQIQITAAGSQAAWYMDNTSLSDVTLFTDSIPAEVNSLVKPFQADSWINTNSEYRVNSDTVINSSRDYIGRHGDFTGNVTLGNPGTTTTHAVRADRLINTENGITGGGNLTSTRTLGLTGQALNFHEFSGTGIITRNGSGNLFGRTIEGTVNRVNVTNGDGISGNPTLSLPQDFHTEAHVELGQLKISELLSSPEYISGTFGDGWFLDPNTPSGSYFEIDNLRVRKEFRTHIFRKEEVRATNGRLYVSDAAEVGETKTFTTNDVGETLIIKAGEGHATFAINDIVLIRSIAPDNTTINNVELTVTGTSTLDDQTTLTVDVIQGGTVQAGDTIVRISGGTLLLDADSEFSPYMDVLDDGSVKTRLGYLEGISNANGYGLWGENTFLTGTLLIGDLTKSPGGHYLEYSNGNLSGSFGNINFISDTFFLESANILIDSENNIVNFGNATNFIDWTNGALEISASTFSLISGDMAIDSNVGIKVNSTNYFKNDSTFSFGSGLLSGTTSTLIIDTGGGHQIADIYLSSVGGQFSLGNKLSWDGSILEISGSGDFSGTITAASGEIGNWTIGTNKIFQEYLTDRFLTLSTSRTDITDTVGLSLYREPITLTTNEDIRLMRFGEISNRDQPNTFTGGHHGIQIGTGADIIGDNIEQGSYQDIFRIDDEGFFLKPSEFNLALFKLNINSTIPKIALGYSANNLSLTNGTGVFMSGATNNAQFKVGSTSNYLKWDGDNISWKSQNTELDTDGNLHASGGSISIFNFDDTTFTTRDTPGSGSGIELLDDGIVQSLTMYAEVGAQPSYDVLSIRSDDTIPLLTGEDSTWDYDHGGDITAEVPTGDPGLVIITTIDGKDYYAFNFDPFDFETDESGTNEIETFDLPVTFSWNISTSGPEPLRSTSFGDDARWYTVVIIGVDDDGGQTTVYESPEFTSDTGRSATLMPSDSGTDFVKFIVRCRYFISVEDQGDLTNSITVNITNFDGVQYTPKFVINSKGMFFVPAPGVIESVIGQGGGGGGTVTTSTTWNSVSNKPFVTLGDSFTTSGASGEEVLELLDISASEQIVGALSYNSHAKESGKLYGGSTNPDGNIRLNYDGHFYANDLRAQRRVGTPELWWSSNLIIRTGIPIGSTRMTIGSTITNHVDTTIAADLDVTGDLDVNGLIDTNTLTLASGETVSSILNTVGGTSNTALLTEGAIVNYVDSQVSSIYSAGTGITIDGSDEISITPITAATNTVGALLYNGASIEPGALYGGTTTPTGNPLLNYAGHFRATQLFEGQSRVATRSYVNSQGFLESGDLLAGNLIGSQVDRYFKTTTNGEIIEQSISQFRNGLTLGSSQSVSFGSILTQGTISAEGNIHSDGIISAGSRNSTEWNTAYDERRQWNGGSTNLSAATGRNSLQLSSTDAVTFASLTLASGQTVGTIASSAGGTSNSVLLTEAAIVNYVDSQVQTYTGGTGITIDGSDEISVDSTVIQTTGAQTISGTKTFTTTAIISGDPNTNLRMVVDMGGVGDGNGIDFYNNSDNTLGARIRSAGNETPYFDLEFYTGMNGSELGNLALRLDYNQNVNFFGNVSVDGNVTGANLNISNWNDAHGWGDHDGLYVGVGGGEFTGAITITHNTIPLTLSTTDSPQIRFDLDGTSTTGTYRMYAWGSSRVLSMESMGDVQVVLDYNNNQTSKMFSVRHNGEGVAGVELFRVHESGLVSVLAGDLDVSGTVTATGGNSTEWNTAYDERRQWNGGSTNLSAATGRNSLQLSSTDAVTFASLTLASGQTVGTIASSAGGVSNSVLLTEGAIVNYVDSQVQTYTGGTGITIDGSDEISLTTISAGSTTVGALAYNGDSISAGRLYGGTTHPVNSTRLNYDGNFHASAGRFGLGGPFNDNPLEVTNNTNQDITTQLRLSNQNTGTGTGTRILFTTSTSNTWQNGAIELVRTNSPESGHTELRFRASTGSGVLSTPGMILKGDSVEFSDPVTFDSDVIFEGSVRIGDRTFASLSTDDFNIASFGVLQTVGLSGTRNFYDQDGWEHIVTIQRGRITSWTVDGV